MMKINFILKTHDLYIPELVKWILSVCLNIHTLTLSLNRESSDNFCNEIVRLTKLKKLDVLAVDASDLKAVTSIAFRIMMTLLTSSQIVRCCRRIKFIETPWGIVHI